MTTAALLLTFALVGGERIHPRDEGVNLVFNPTYFAYKHEYKFENLKEEARSVYFLLPRNCQEHTITSATYTVGGKALDYKIVTETPGWQVARAEVPLSRNFSVIMDVRGVHWNGKLSRERSQIPADIAPPPISDEKMKWYVAPSPYLARVQPRFSRSLVERGLATLASDFLRAFRTTATHLAQNVKYESGAHTFEDFLAGSGNCNGLNGALSAVFDLEGSATFVGVEMNGLLMASSGHVHAMSFVGKRGWSHLVPTDAVKFNINNLDPNFLSGHSMGPMLLFQEGLGDPEADPKGGVLFPSGVYDKGPNIRAPNPGGIITAISSDGSQRVKNAGVKLSFTQTPVTDFDALRRELGIKPGEN